jgi:hypothetical protein
LKYIDIFVDTIYLIRKNTKVNAGWDTSVGIANNYELVGAGSNPGGDEIFQNRPGAHPASCTMGNISIPGVEAAGTWG